MRHFIALLLSFSVWASTADAQEKDSIFANYNDYTVFVDRHIMQRDFIPLILRLGGRDEYTPEQMNATDNQLRAAWPTNFPNKTVMRQTDLGGGIMHEGRVYWNGTSYAYFYALLHARGTDLVVLSFHLNTSTKEIMSRF